MARVDLRPIEVQRAKLGLSSPIPEEKLLVWSMVTMPQTTIRKEEGGYVPYSVLQQAHFHPARTVLVAGGIRGSKSMGAAMEALSWLPHGDLLWLAGQSYDDCRQEFEYVAEAAISLGWTTSRMVNMPMNRYNPCAFETVWGSKLETKSAADPGSLMSRAPTFIALCEPGKMNIAAYRRAQERLSTWRGKLWLPGTFEQSEPWMEEYWRLWKRWPNSYNAKSFTAPTWINRAIYPEGLHDPEITKLRNDAEDFDQFLRRIAGVPASQPDIIFSDTWRPRHHVGPVEFERRASATSHEFAPVYAAIDPGYGGESRYVVLAVQLRGSHVRVIDEIAVQGKTHQEVKAIALRRQWWPHMTRGTIDPYAGDSHVYGSVSPKDVWGDANIHGSVRLDLPQRLHVDDLIRVIKSYLNGSSGFTLEISNRCERLQEEFMKWKRIRSSTQNLLGNPQKNMCDAIKALGYFLVHHQNGQINPSRPDIFISPYSLTSRDPIYTLIDEVSNPINNFGIAGAANELVIG